MKYSFTCPADNQVLSVEANTDAEALKKIMVVGEQHVKAHHKNAAPMTEEETKKMFTSGWKKG